MEKLLRLVLRQTTRSMVRLQRQLHLNHTVKRAAMSGDIFLDNEHLDYNTFQTKWATASSPPSSSTTPPPVTTASSDGNRPLNAYELQSMFYGDFLPTFLEENPSLLHDWSYEKGAPPPNEIFDQIILEFYAKHLPNQTMVGRSEAAKVLDFFPTHFPEWTEEYEDEVGMFLVDDDHPEMLGNEAREKDGEEEDDDVYLEQIFLLGDEDEDEDTYPPELTAGCDLLDDTQLFNEQWLQEQLEHHRHSAAAFVRGTMALTWEQLIEEGYIIEPHMVQKDVVVGELTQEEDQRLLLQQRNIDVGFSMLRKCNHHIDYVESLVEGGVFQPKQRRSTAAKEDSVSEEVPTGAPVATPVANVIAKSLGVQYCVGQSLVHRHYGACVVTGWDKTCEANDEWCRMNNIDEVLRHGRHQPFYNVLCEDGEYRYCSQENLVQRAAKECVAPIDHKAVGYFFVDYEEGTGIHLMNDEIRDRYPEDDVVGGGDRFRIERQAVEEARNDEGREATGEEKEDRAAAGRLVGEEGEEVEVVPSSNLKTAQTAVSEFINLRKDR